MSDFHIPEWSYAATPKNAEDFFLEFFLSGQRAHVAIVAMRLGLFDKLQKGPKTAEEINKELNLAKVSFTERILNALAAFALLEKTKNVYKTTALANECLTNTGVHAFPDAEPFLGNWEIQVEPLLKVLTGKTDPSFKDIYGEGEKSVVSDLEKAKAFVGMMDMVTKLSVNLLDTCQFDTYSSAVDLGGASGVWGRAVARKNTSTKVTVVDLKNVVEAAKSMVPPTKNVTFEAGDFFKGNLPKADLYILGHIIHNWQDEQVLLILKHVHDALPKGGTLLIVEKIMNDDKVGPLFATIYDIMMLHRGGLERTIAEHTVLLDKSGFTLTESKRRKGNNFCDAILAEKQ